jgi:hypothetical protein
MRKLIFTLATGLFLVAGASTSNACDSHGKKVTKAATGAEAKVEKKECTTAEKKECATTKTASASGQKSCCASKSKSVSAEKKENKQTETATDEAKL